MRRTAVVVALVALIGLTGGSPALGATCADLLEDKAYTCNLRSPLNPDQSAALTFGTLPDATFAPFFEVLKCNCEATGTFNNPHFDQSKRFNCVGIQDDGSAIAISGKVVAGGKRIKAQGMVSVTAPVAGAESGVIACELYE